MVYVLTVQQPAISLHLQETLFLTTWIKASPGAISISCLVIHCATATLDYSITFPTSCVRSALLFFLSTCVWLKKKPGLFREELTTWFGVVKHIFSPEKHLTLQWNAVKTAVQLTFSLKRCFIMTTLHWNYIIVL